MNMLRNNGFDLSVISKQVDKECCLIRLNCGCILYIYFLYIYIYVCVYIYIVNIYIYTHIYIYKKYIYNIQPQFSLIKQHSLSTCLLMTLKSKPLFLNMFIALLLSWKHAFLIYKMG